MLINLSVWFWFLFYLQVRLNIKSLAYLAYISLFVILSIPLLFSAGINFLSNSGKKKKALLQTKLVEVMEFQLSYFKS